ncbi:MAG: hypothetical protein HC890_11215 [Chloroflexaceae bacterium]|nr:hypothetical protein [Chloroflexaceae bacterium]
MALISLRAWYLKQYEPIKEVVKRPHDLRLSRSGLLKSGLRADFLEEIQQVQESDWFGRYLEGDRIEFYIEGSGGYVVANVDLISHEIYFTKQDLASWLDPIVFLSYQTEYDPAGSALQAVLTDTIIDLNRRSRLTLTLEKSHRPPEAPLRLSDTQLRKIRKCLLFVADRTAIAAFPQEGKSRLLPSPNVSVEIGYALQSKRPGQILLVSMERADLKGLFPFDLPQHQQLQFKDAKDLNKTLPGLVEALLQRFNLLH